jgi:ABC-type lipoprotein release transport system permease subunit
MWAAGLWARAELRRSWRSLLGLAVLSGVAAGVVVAAVAGAMWAGSSVDRFETVTQTSHVTIFTDDDLDYHVATALDGDPRVADRSELTVLTVAPEGLVPGLDAITVLGSELGGIQFRPWAITGRLPRPGEVDAVAVTEVTGQRLGLGVGDRVGMEYYDQATGIDCRNGDAEACADLRSAGTVNVVGVVRTPTDLAVNSFQQNVLVADDAFRQRLGDELPVVGYIESLRLHRRDDAAEVAAEYSVMVGDAGDALSSLRDLDGPRRAVGLQRTALLIGAAVGGMALAVTIGQAYGRHLSRASGQVETLDALGMRRRGRIAASTLPAFAVAAIASVVSAGTAVALSPILPFGLARRADPGTGLRADAALLVPAALVVAIGVGAVGLIAAALWARSPAWRARRSGRTPAPSELAVISGLSPAGATGARFALVRGAGRYRLPVASTIAAATTAVALAVGLLVVSHSLDGLLGTPDRYGAPWDAGVPLDPSAVREDAARVAGDPRVDRAAVLASGELTIEAVRGEPVQLPAAGFEHVAGRLDPVVLDGRLPGAPDEVALGTETYRSLGLSLGDQVRLFGPGGHRRATVVGRLIVPSVGIGDVQRGMVVPLATFEELGAGELLADVDVEAYLVVRLAAGTSLEGYTAELASGQPPRRADLPSQPAEVRALREVDAVPLLLGGFTAVLAVAAVAHALSVASRRRGADLAVLRALGLRPRQTAHVVRWHGLTIAAAALVVGIPCGLAAGRLVWAAIASSVSVPTVTDLPGAALAATVAVAVALAVLVAVPPGRRVARSCPADLLRAE